MGRIGEDTEVGSVSVVEQGKFENAHAGNLAIDPASKKGSITAKAGLEPDFDLTTQPRRRERAFVSLGPLIDLVPSVNGLGITEVDAFDLHDPDRRRTPPNAKPNKWAP